MKPKLFLLLFLSAVVFTTAYADDVTLKMKKKDIQDTQQKKEAVSEGFTNGGRKTAETIKEIKAEREVLYTNVVKRYGRWEGYGKPITKDFASHLEYYFKLIYTAGAKYPSRMQAYDGYHQLTRNHKIRTYLVSDGENDADADSTWVEKINSVVQWDFVYNDKGDIAIERAYDANGELVYSYYPVKIGNRIAGTFTDAWGMPAKLRKSGGAQVVYITYDENGFECLYEFYDELGYRQKNRDGAYMTRSTKRSDGLEEAQASCNIAGRRMMDNFGNCGFASEYNQKGVLISAIYMDDNWNPIRIEHGNNPFYTNTIKHQYEFDKYNRGTKAYFVDLKNRPDTNSVGIHSIVWTYNDRGRATSCSFYDIKDSLRINPYTGVTRWENEFDSEGRITVSKVYGDSATLSETSYKEQRLSYDKEGNELAQISVCFNGDSIINRYYKRDGDQLQVLTSKDTLPKNYVAIREFFNQDSMRIRIEHDERGNQTLWQYSDLSGKPSMPYGYWKNITEREYFGDSLEVTTDYYVDTQNKVVKLNSNVWGIQKNVKKYQNDTLVYINTFLYNADSTLYQSWRNIYNSDGNKIGEAYINQYGNISRLGNAICHHCSIEYDIKGENLSSYVGFNEFDEPAYLENDSKVFHFFNNTNGTRTYYDENGAEITDMGSFKDSLPAVMCISVVDSVAYRLGLKDGDVILKYGDWCPATDMQSQLASGTFNFKLIEFADREKEVVVMRHIPEEHKSVILTFTLPVGTIQDLGIFPQLIYYTRRELKRYEETVDNYLQSNGLETLGNHDTMNGNNGLRILRPNRISGYIPTRWGVSPLYYNPSVLLSLANCEVRNGAITSDRYWYLGMAMDTLSLVDENSNCYITTSADLKTSFDGFPLNNDAFELGLAFINDEQLARVSSALDQFMDRYGYVFNPDFRKSQIVVAPKKESKQLTPNEYFQKVKKEKGCVYMKNAINFINNDSIYLPECFENLEMLYIAKAQTPELYENIKAEIQTIDTTGYLKLPNFYYGSLALVKRVGDNLFSELFIAYVGGAQIRVLRQKGLFSYDELMAMQSLFGKKNATSLYEEEDQQSQIPLVLGRVELDGLARQAGVEGCFVILEFDSWNMSQGLDHVQETIEHGKISKKRLIMMPVYWKSDNSFDHFGAPLVYNFDMGTLGMRILDWNIQQSLYDRAASIYEKFKRNHR